MFLSINNNMRIASARKHLDERVYKYLPTDCMLKAIQPCLSFNNSAFNNTNSLHTNGTAQGPHMSFSYTYIAMDDHDSKATNYFLIHTTWKSFRNDIFAAGNMELMHFLNSDNNA